MLGWITRLGDALRQQSTLAEKIQENASQGESGSDPNSSTSYHVEENLDSQIDSPTLVFGLSNQTKEQLLQEGKHADGMDGFARFVKGARDETRSATIDAIREGDQYEAQLETTGRQTGERALQESRSATSQMIDTANRIASKLESYGASSSVAPAKESSPDLGAEL